MTDEALLAAIRELKDEVRESRKESQDMRDRMARMEGKLDVMSSIKETAEDAKDTAKEALQYAKSAHHRIDELKIDHEKDIEKIEGNQTWLWRTALTALVSGIVAAISLVIGFLTNHK